MVTEVPEEDTEEETSKVDTEVVTDKKVASEASEDPEVVMLKVATEAEEDIEMIMKVATEATEKKVATEDPEEDIEVKITKVATEVEIDKKAASEDPEEDSEEKAEVASEAPEVVRDQKNESLRVVFFHILLKKYELSHINSNKNLMKINLFKSYYTTRIL